MKFAVGEVAVLTVEVVAVACWEGPCQRVTMRGPVVADAGEHVTVCAIWPVVPGWVAGSFPLPYDYEIVLQNGSTALALEHHLRKLRPPASTWDDVEAASGWNPNRQPVEA